MLDNIIFLVGYIALWAAVVRYDVHMFQHNSYRVERYARWFRGGHKFARAAAIAVLAIIGAIKNPVFLGFSVVFMLLMACRRQQQTLHAHRIYNRLLIHGAELAPRHQ